ncbi:MAG: tyrosine-type recombinase/integrase [Planctomycetaceae bacterium]|nr:tyrosine-type recombinase/integrase [Planctomycetaceae bacterium]
MAHAVRLSLIASNPCTSVQRPRVQQKEIVPFTEAEVRAILKDRKDNRLYALFILAFSTGLRQGEMFGIRIEDIDIKNKLIRIVRSSSEATGQHLKETKTSAGKRTVPLTKSCLGAIKDRIEAIKKEKCADLGFLFTSEERF